MPGGRYKWKALTPKLGIIVFVDLSENLNLSYGFNRINNMNKKTDIMCSLNRVYFDVQT